MRMLRHKIRPDGLSLMEVIFSLTLLGLVTVLVMNLFPSSMVTVKKAEYRMQANTLAETVLAEQAARPYDELVVGAPPDIAAQIVEGVDYLVTTEVRAVPDRLPEYVKSVHVTVSWTVRNIDQRLERELWVPAVER
jgi:Tfp pilus assembly protein PilV